MYFLGNRQIRCCGLYHAVELLTATISVGGRGGVTINDVLYFWVCNISVCQINLLCNRIWKLKSLLLHCHSFYSPVVSLKKHCGKSCGIGCNFALDWRNQGWSSSVFTSYCLSRFQMSVLTVANYEICLCIWRMVFYFCYIFILLTS